MLCSFRNHGNDENHVNDENDVNDVNDVNESNDENDENYCERNASHVRSSYLL